MCLTSANASRVRYQMLAKRCKRNQASLKLLCGLCSHPALIGVENCFAHDDTLWRHLHLLVIQDVHECLFQLFLLRRSTAASGAVAVMFPGDVGLNVGHVAVLTKDHTLIDFCPLLNKQHT